MNRDFTTIERQTGKAFLVNKGEILTVKDPLGQQVSDMVLFNRHDHDEKISSIRFSLKPISMVGFLSSKMATRFMKNFRGLKILK